ncbi:group I truncated hemoglobin [Limnoglobus roseus]|uniref:Group 1 truncated hemoglobin n=1 Tax=Limnoglobus roseus TaxID=2598579 RepID=A0A5C1AE71_9BACT|nr:group 1 truncated hemoglobin [Limnoglobus roseus]QEL15378.1 group 1 truncated hemoglobin [Limnoglobus roseus]
MRRIPTGWIGVLLVLAAPAFGQDKALSDKMMADKMAADKMTMDQDKKIASLIYETVKEGVELYNGGNQEGCLRLYQGSLMTLQGVLDYRPTTAKAIKDALAAAKTQKTSDASFTLRKALDGAQADLTAKAMAKAADAKPLWDRLGGEKAVAAVVHDFVIAAAPDPKVNFFRDGKYKLDDAGVKKLETMLVEMISSATGGPLKYNGRNMKDTHKGMKITEEEFNALAGHLVATLKKYNVPQAEMDELVGIVASTKGDIVEVK